MSSRPRRSTAGSQSYVHLLKPASDFDSSSSNDDDSDAEAGPSAAAKGKGKASPQSSSKAGANGKAAKKKKKRAASDSSSEGSVFELDEDDKKQASSDDEEVEATEDDEGPAPSADDDDGSDGLVSVASDGGSARGGRGRGKQPARVRLGPSKRAGPVRQHEAGIIAAGESMAYKGPSRKPRARPLPRETLGWGSKALQQLFEMGPTYEPPSRWLDIADNDNRLLSQTPAVIGPPSEYKVRARLSLAWTHLPFGPEKSVLQDLGWWKDKWDDDGENDPGIQESWGGWYPTVQPIVGDRLTDDDELAPYLPSLVYPSVPRRLMTDDPTDAMAVDDDIGAGEDVSEMPTTIKLRIGPVDPSNDDVEQQLLVSIPRFSSERLDKYYPTKPGHIFNAGGPVTSVSWLYRPDTIPVYTREYLAVSTQSSPQLFHHLPSPQPSSIQIWSLDTSVPTDLARCTGEHDKGDGMEMAMLLCVDIGEAMSVQWCPKGGNEWCPPGNKLGILAGVFTDGTVSLFAVPEPDVVREAEEVPENEILAVRASPILVLRLPNTSCLSFSWGSHETIAAGCMNGSVAVWSVKSALESGAQTAWPIQYFNAHTAPIRSLAYVRVPPFSSELDGTTDTCGEPTNILTTGYDGVTRMTDLRDPALQYQLSLERGSFMAVEYSTYSSAALVVDLDSHVMAVSLKPQILGQSRQIIQQRGAVWSITASDHHVFVATTSADGTCTIGNAVRAQHKITHNKKFSQKVYRIDFSRRTGEYRIVDNILPEARTNPEEQAKAAKASKKKPAKPKKPPKATKKNLARLDYNSEDEKPPEDAPVAVAWQPVSIDPGDGVTTAAWSPETGVLCSKWHPNLDRACLLASGMACGLVRVDWIERTWLGRAPKNVRGQDSLPVDPDSD